MFWWRSLCTAYICHCRLYPAATVFGAPGTRHPIHTAFVQLAPKTSLCIRQNPDSICKCMFVSRPRNISGFEDCWGIGAIFELEDLFKLVIPSSCCGEPLKQQLWVDLYRLIVDSDIWCRWVWQPGIFPRSCVASFLAEPLTSRSSLLLSLRCPRLPYCQHWFLSQCFANCSSHWMCFEIQETIIVHMSLSYISLALLWSSLYAAHLCCTVHQWAAALHHLPQRKPGVTSTRRGDGFRSCHVICLNIHLSSCSARGPAQWQDQGKSCPYPILSTYNVEPLVEVSGNLWMGFMKLMYLLQVHKLCPRRLNKAYHTLLGCGVHRCPPVLIWGACAICPV